MKKIDANQLIDFCTRLFVRAGMEKEPAGITAQTLVEADLLGHTTHGTALVTPYLESIQAGGMNLSGEPEVIRDTGSTIVWNGQYLPGCWLTHQAIDQLLDRNHQYPVMTLAMNRSHHIGCLAAYLERVTDRGLILILSCTDPKNKTVAPYGGLTGKYSPNPLAFGIPTEGDPILVDISMSVTSNGLIHKSRTQNKKLPHPWLLTPDGSTSTDPDTFFADPPATILPLGGLESGYKGLSLAILIEILTSGLSGYGRADHPTRWGASVFMQLIDPEAFGGAAQLRRQAEYLKESFMQSTPLDPENPVRIPGARALGLKSKQLKEGIELDSGVIDSLNRWAHELGVQTLI